jgi:hypothetical protein
MHTSLRGTASHKSLTRVMPMLSSAAMQLANSAARAGSASHTKACWMSSTRVM